MEIARVLLLDEPSEGLAPLIVSDVGRAMTRPEEGGNPAFWASKIDRSPWKLGDRAVLLTPGAAF